MGDFGPLNICYEPGSWVIGSQVVVVTLCHTTLKNFTQIFFRNGVVYGLIILDMWLQMGLKVSWKKKELDCTCSKDVVITACKTEKSKG